MSKTITILNTMTRSKSKIIFGSIIVGTFMILFLSFSFFRYLNNIKYFNKIAITAIDYKGNVVQNVLVYGITPTNKTVKLDSDGSTTIWDNTFGLFKSFHLKAKSESSDSIAYINVTLYIKNNIQTFKQINNFNIITDREVEIKDSNFFNMSYIEKLFIVTTRLFSRNFNSSFFLISLLFALFLIIFLLKKININFLKFIISFFLLLLIIVNGGIIHPDTKSYLDFAMQRPLIYPIFLYLFDTIWSTHIILILTCGLIGLVSAHLLSKKINSIFFTSNLIEVFYFLILLLPYIINEYLVANYLLAESISYPLFMLFLYYSISVLESNYQKHNIIKLLIISSLLILTRGQFVIIYPAIVILGIYSLIIQKKKKFLFIILSILAFFITNIVDSSYHLIKHGKFEKTNFGGYMLSGNALYSSLPSDSTLFENSDRELFKNISENIEKNKLRYTFVINETDQNRKIHYFESFDNIIWREGVNKGFDKYIESIKKTSQNNNSYNDTIQSIQNILKTINKDEPKDFYALYLNFENKINSEIKKEFSKKAKRTTTKDYLSSDETFYFKILKIKNLNSYIEIDKLNDEQFNWNTQNKILLKISLKLIANNFSKSFNTSYLNLKDNQFLRLP